MPKYSVVIAGHPTSISLEVPFWDALQDIAVRQNLSVNALITEIDESRLESNLSSAVRIYILKDLQNRLALEKHSGS